MLDEIQPGDRLGDYEILKQIGSGGMGNVYLTQHVFLKKRFAVKVLPKKFTENKAFVTVFQQEGQTLASLKHENITTVHNFGVQDGLYFLVMDYISGGTIEDYRLSCGGQMPPEEVLNTLLAVAAGLEHAHEVGIVHRDLKPENFLIDKDGTVKISDFGIAQFLGAADGAHITRSANTVVHLAERQRNAAHYVGGTEGYMAPELAEHGFVDHRADFYSLGVIAYFLLTGKQPGLHSKRATSLVKGLPKQWDKIIEKCVAYSPDERYQNAAALQKDLHLLQKKYQSKQFRLVVAGSLVLIVVGVGVITGLLLKNQSSQPLPEIPAPVETPQPEPKEETAPVESPEKPVREPKPPKPKPPKPAQENKEKPVIKKPTEYDITKIQVPATPVEKPVVKEKEPIKSSEDSPKPEAENSETPASEENKISETESDNDEAVNDEKVSKISLRVFSEDGYLLDAEEYEVFVDDVLVRPMGGTQTYALPLDLSKPNFKFLVRSEGHSIYYRRFTTPREVRTVSLELTLPLIEDTYDYYQSLLQEFLPSTSWQIIHATSVFPYELIDFRNSGFVRVDENMHRWEILGDGRVRLVIDEKYFLLDFNESLNRISISDTANKTIAIGIVRDN